MSETPDPALLDAPVNLDGLPDLAAGARVVAIGETAHYVPAYLRLRRQTVEILVRKAGFTVVALESAFSEGLAVDAWLAGAPGPFPSGSLTYGFGAAAETRDLFAWLRSTGGVRYCGIDLPGGLASMRPALDHVAEAAPDLPPAEIRRLAGAYAGPHRISAFAPTGPCRPPTATG